MTIIHDAVEAAWQDGFDAGYQAAKDEAFNAGYDCGYQDGIERAQTKLDGDEW